MEPFICPHCTLPVRILIFHDNGRQSCHKCAPEVRKLGRMEVGSKRPQYHKTGRGYIVAR